MTDSLPSAMRTTTPAPHLVVATPCFGGLVTQRYMQSVFALLQLGSRLGWTVSVELLGHDSLITRSRNTLVTRFLDKPDATHLLFVDADIGFEADQVVRMLGLGADVVGGVYPLKLIDWAGGGMRRAVEGEPIDSAPLRYVGTPDEGPDREERDGFVTGLYAGTGFLMIRRTALLRLIEASPHLRYRGTHTIASAAPARDQFALFDCMIDPATGIYLSEDYAFCRRWRDIGGRVWLDLRGPLVHVGTHEFPRTARGPLPADAGARGRIDALPWASRNEPDRSGHR